MKKRKIRPVRNLTSIALMCTPQSLTRPTQLSSPMMMMMMVVVVVVVVVIIIDDNNGDSGDNYLKLDIWFLFVLNCCNFLKLLVLHSEEWYPNRGARDR
jgi:hypothetical protein